MPTLPIAVIGAGPVGLAAAAHLAEREQPFVVLEAGPTVGASVLEWGHVTLFSPWRYAIDEASARLLAGTGWERPDPDHYPTGHDLVVDYLRPLGAHPSIAPHLRLEHRVTAISRLGLDKLSSAGREDRPFELRVEGPEGPASLRVRAVIDASGTWNHPNPIGSDGLPVAGEEGMASQLLQRIPDVLGRDRARFAGRRTAVVGAGHSAFTALVDLAALASQEPDTEVTWLVRRADHPDRFGGGGNDALPRRGALGTAVRHAVEAGTIHLEAGLRVSGLHRADDGVVIEAMDLEGLPRRLPPVDQVVALTGFRPDRDLTAELRVDLDPIVEAPRALAPLIDPNLHSCGTVPPHGIEELSHPEPGYVAVGMKSYGRAPTFLLLTGYEQVRSTVAALAGDHDAARNVSLDLPETGVCSGPGLAASDDAIPSSPQALGLVSVGQTSLPQTEDRSSCC